MIKSIAAIAAAAVIALPGGAGYTPPNGSDRYAPHQGDAHMLNLPHGKIARGVRLDVQGHINPFLVCSGCDDWSWWKVSHVGKLRVTTSGPFLSAKINKADRGKQIIQWYYEGKGHDPRHPFCAATFVPDHPRFVILAPCSPATRWVKYFDTPQGNDPSAFASISIAATNKLSGKNGTAQYALYNLSRDGNLSTVNKLGFFNGVILGPESWDVCSHAPACVAP